MSTGQAIPVARILEAAKTGGELAKAAAELLRHLDAHRPRDGWPSGLVMPITRLRAELDARGAAETVVQWAETFGIAEELEIRALFTSLRKAIDHIEEAYTTE